MTPDNYTNQELFLDVGDGHQLYVQDWGNPKAKIPIVFLHGGPGASCNDGHKQPFDPLQQRVIFFDQRGSGKSLPTGSLDHNTTADLIEDINKIVAKCNIAQFTICGRSWGSCLAFCYALKYPEKVHAIVTGGIFLASKEELDFDDRGERYATFFPDVWEDFLQHTPSEEHAAAVKYHIRNVLSDDPAKAKESAYRYSQLIMGVLRLDDRAKALDYETFDDSGIRIEAHYKLHGCFLKDNFIMKHAASLTMPIWIVQGRYDVMCVPAVAYRLAQELPNANLLWTTAGHSGGDRANYDVTQALLRHIC